LEKDGFA